MARIIQPAAQSRAICSRRIGPESEMCFDRNGDKIAGRGLLPAPSADVNYLLGWFHNFAADREGVACLVRTFDAV
jgi:hypothetical protein